MSAADVTDVIMKLGFPVAVAAFVLVRIDPLLRKLTDAVQGLTTAVAVADLPEGLVLAHSASAEDLDKAGGYAIQGRAGSFVTHIDGCFNNVVGLPLHRVCDELRKIALATPE